MSERAPWQTHFGFTRTPFGKTLAPSELFTRAPHEEAVARIRHCIAESALGVITGEVGTGKTVAARAARASLDPSRHALIYIANPRSGPGACMSAWSGRSEATPASTRPRSWPRRVSCSRRRRPSATGGW